MRKIWLFMLVGLVAVSCKNNETDPEPEPGPGNGDYEITVTPTSTPNVYTLSSNAPATVTPTWKTGRGDGEELTGKEVTASYPVKGNYTITMSFMSPSTYEQVTVTKALEVTTNNTSLISISAEKLTMLAGASGKNWVLDSLKPGHIGTGQSSITYPGDWEAPKLNKTGTGMYLQKMTFNPNFGFTLVNNGLAFGAGVASEAEMIARGAILIKGGEGANGEDPQWEDRVYEYTAGTDWMWQYKTDGDKEYVYFAPKTGYMIFFRPSPQCYEITKLTADVMHVRQVSTEYKEDNVALYMKFIQEGYTPPILEEEVYAEEDFEGVLSDFIQGFVKDDLGTGTEFGVANPKKDEVNGSDMVAKYDRGTALHGRLIWTNPTGKIDFSKYNKVSMKVYIPSDNDYVTEDEGAADWSDGLLKKQAVVRFLDGDAAEPWQPEHRIEKVNENLETDKWLELTFDLSEHEDRTDMSQMVIQFGAEGHHRPGIFYFDDLRFYGGGE